MNRLKGRSALVTGGGQGIGLAIALRFLKEGARVLIVDRNPDALEQARSTLLAEGETVETFTAELAEADAAETIQSHADTVFGGIDILVNNAGVAGSKAVGDLSVERWDEVMAINLTAVFRLSRLIVPAMAARGYGRVINIASMMGLVGFRQNSDYSVSKAAIVALTRSLAADYGDRGVTANAIAPGPILTPLVEGIISNRPKWYLRGAVHGKPVQRMGKPEDIAAAAAYFASEEAGFVTGQVLAVDGGMTGTRYVPDAYPDEVG